MLLCAIALAPSSTLSKDTSRPADSAPAAASDISGWAAAAAPRAADPDLGFSPLSVTQDGVAYTPAAPAFDPGAGDQPKIADLPAWASSRFTTPADRPQVHAGFLGALGFGALPEPAAWALVLIGTAMICGALRGLIMANRRLARLSDAEEDEQA
jgi:hypothetical protein